MKPFNYLLFWSKEVCSKNKAIHLTAFRVVASFHERLNKTLSTMLDFINSFSLQILEINRSLQLKNVSQNEESCVVELLGLGLVVK